MLSWLTGGLWTMGGYRLHSVKSLLYIVLLIVLDRPDPF